MDKTERISEIQKELKAIKEKNPAELAKATEKLNELKKKYPDLKEDTDLQYMIVFAYIHVGDKIDEEIIPAFKEYDGPYKAIASKLKRDPQSIRSYLFLALDNLVLKSERSHNVYIISKKGPRTVQVLNKDTGIKEDRDVLSLTLWIDDMKAMTTLAVWADQIPLYLPLQEGKTYKMQLNYNGTMFFAPRDPMAKEFEFKPDQEKMIEFITEHYIEMKEPYSALENSDRTKSYYMIGRILKEAGGNIIISPINPTTSQISLMRTADSRFLNDGEDVLVVGALQKTRSFMGRDGKMVQPTSDYTLFPNAIIRLSPPDQTEDNTVVNPEASSVPSENNNTQTPSPDDLGL